MEFFEKGTYPKRALFLSRHDEGRLWERWTIEISLKKEASMGIDFCVTSNSSI